MGEKLKILLIDDEINFVENLADILIYQDYTVDTALNGEAGIEKVPLFKPDLIICDVSMPKMNGYEVLQTLKENDNTFNIPFIFLTGKAEVKELRKGMELGADDYLTKPFNAKDLLTAIQVRLKKHKKESGIYESKILDIKKVVSKTLPHELRSPLNTILGFTQLIRSRFDEFDKAEIMNMLSDIELSGKKLLRLISNYNFYNRLVNDPDSFKINGGLSAIYSSLILDAVPYEIAAKYNRVSNLKLELKNATIQITNECFKKLVEELTDNSFKFSNPDSDVTIRTSEDEDNYFIEFIDEGIEMNMDQFAGIGAFEQFGRDTNEQQGTGMGLAIVSQIVYIWEGKLELITEPGGKTTFKVTLKKSNEKPSM